MRHSDLWRICATLTQARSSFHRQSDAGKASVTSTPVAQQRIDRRNAMTGNWSLNCQLGPFSGGIPNDAFSAYDDSREQSRRNAQFLLRQAWDEAVAQTGLSKRRIYSCVRRLW